MYGCELDCEESWALKHWCIWTVVLEKTLESPLDCKEIHPVHSEGDQPWDSFGGNDAEAETPVLWPPRVKSWLIGKDSDAERDWGQEEKGTTEDGMAGWHHWLDGRESEWTPGVGDGQGGLACSDSWGCKELDTTETKLNWTELSAPLFFPLKRSYFQPVWSWGCCLLCALHLGYQQCQGLFSLTFGSMSVFYFQVKAECLSHWRCITSCTSFFNFPSSRNSILFYHLSAS